MYVEILLIKTGDLSELLTERSTCLQQNSCGFCARTRFGHVNFLVHLQLKIFLIIFFTLMHATSFLIAVMRNVTYRYFSPSSSIIFRKAIHVELSIIPLSSLHQSSLCNLHIRRHINIVAHDVIVGWVVHLLNTWQNVDPHVVLNSLMLVYHQLLHLQQ